MHKQNKSYLGQECGLSGDVNGLAMHSIRSSRTFPPTEAKGGLGIDPSHTAVMFIEMQNEFVSEGGLLHGQVKDVIAATGCVGKAAQLAKVQAPRDG